MILGIIIGVVGTLAVVSLLWWYALKDPVEDLDDDEILCCQQREMLKDPVYETDEERTTQDIEYA